MRRLVVVAALVAAGAGLVVISAPARGATGHAGIMVGASAATYRFAEGQCQSQPSGDAAFDIQVGDSIKWTNCSNTGHTVSGEGFGSSDVVAPGDSTPTFTFSSPGEFEYSCTIHPVAMRGIVTVTGNPEPTQPTTPITTATTTPPPPTASTTTSTTVARTTSTTSELDGVFGGPTSSTTPTSIDPTVTTRALGEGGSAGTSAGVVALLVVGLGAVGTAGALLVRRMRGGVPPS